MTVSVDSSNQSLDLKTIHQQLNGNCWNGWMDCCIDGMEMQLRDNSLSFQSGICTQKHHLEHSCTVQ